ncbi:MAG: hypothetical protein ABI333_26080 [bacterium]
MRIGKWILVCLSLALLAPACGKKADKAGSGKAKAPELTPEQIKAKKDAAIEGAKAAAIAAFDKVKAKFRECDQMRLDALAEIRSGIRYKSRSRSGLKTLKSSRVCLEKWWSDIDTALKPKNIGRDLWMPHFKPWSTGVMKVVIPTAKPMAGGKAYVVKRGKKGNTVTVTAPADWTQKKGKGKDKNRLELRAENLEFGLTLDFEGTMKPITEYIEIWRCSSTVLLAQKYDVHGLTGALKVSYSKHIGSALFEWRGELGVHPKHRFGDAVTVNMTYGKSPWVTKAQIQQFIDLLGAMKLKVPPRKK